MGYKLNINLHLFYLQLVSGVIRIFRCNEGQRKIVLSWGCKQICPSFGRDPAELLSWSWQVVCIEFPLVIYLLRSLKMSLNALLYKIKEVQVCKTSFNFPFSYNFVPIRSWSRFCSVAFCLCWKKLMDLQCWITLSNECDLTTMDSQDETHDYKETCHESRHVLSSVGGRIYQRPISTISIIHKCFLFSSFQFCRSWGDTEEISRVGDRIAGQDEENQTSRKVSTNTSLVTVFLQWRDGLFYVCLILIG